MRLLVLALAAAAALAGAAAAGADRPTGTPTLASLGAFRGAGQGQRTASLARPSRCGGPGAYGWPVKPFHVPHPVRGDFGDPRTVFETLAGAVSFHNGIDIAAPAGTPVYPVVSGVAWVMGPQEIVVRTDDGRSFQYWHLKPAVLDADHVAAGRTVLGRVLRQAGHVHLAEIDEGVVRNPLAPGHLAPYEDRTPPAVHGVAFRDPAGAPLDPDALHGPVTVVAWADDAPSLPVPGPWHGLPVAPAAVLVAVDGVVRAATDFRRTIPRQESFWQVYASGTYQNAPVVGRRLYSGRRGRYLFRLGLPPLAPGLHELEVVAEDVCGNRGTLTERVRASGVALEPAVPPLGAPREDQPLRWPRGRTAYTVVLASLPARGSGAAATASARRAIAAGIRDVGVLRSSSFAGLAPGFRVLFSGVYRSAAEAAQAAFQVSSVYPGAYPRLVVSRAPARPAEPRRRSHDVLVLASVPVAEGLPAARRELARARQAGLADVRVLRSDRVRGLRPGYWVVVSAPGPIPPIYPDAYLRRL